MTIIIQKMETIQIQSSIDHGVPKSSGKKNLPWPESRKNALKREKQ